MPLQATRREVLGVTAAGLTALAGCSSLTNNPSTETTSEPEFGEADSVWPMLGQNPANTSFADIQFPEAGFRSQELFEAANEDRTDAPILASGHLLVSRASDGDGSTGVFGINPETGDQQWQNSNYVGYTTPSVYGQTAIISGNGMTAAIDVNSGERHWEQSIGGSGFYKTHLKIDDTIVISTGTGQNIVGLDAATGEKQWSSPALGVIFGLATNGVRVVATRTNNEESGLVAIDSNSSEIDWTTSKTSGVGQPVAASGLVLHTDVDTGVLHAFNMENGKREWQYPTDNDVSAPPAVDLNADRVFLAGPNSGLHVLDLQTGEPQWTVDAPGVKQPVVTQNSVLTCAAERIFQVSRAKQTATEIASPGKSISSPLAIGPDQIFFTARSDEDGGAGCIEIGGSGATDT